ncbi:MULTISPECIES: excalibur calcium-binding protein [unclassified Streptomyces]|uniref:excalibur calcium-binding protein n=1 Tax=unclassified Streptomyces TaxID=2593676 RepID=UPI003D74EF8D
MPRSHTGAVGVLFAVAAIVPAAGPAQAQDVDLDCRHFTYQEDAQAVFDADPSDPNRLDADDDGIPCEALPHRGDPVTSSTSRPSAPAAVVPTRGTQGGLGGSTRTGPSDWDIGIGLVFVTGAAVGTGFLLGRRRSPRHGFPAVRRR